MTEVRDRIRRRWWVVLLCVLVAVGGALVTGLGATTTYTSKASLTTYSANRAPEQDAVLIQSYVDLFTSDAGQQSLRRDARIPRRHHGDRDAVATGPIMFVVASGPDPAAVARAAQTMADGFRQSINAGVQRTRQAALDALRKPFADREADNDFILQQSGSICSSRSIASTATPAAAAEPDGRHRTDRRTAGHDSPSGGVGVSSTPRRAGPRLVGRRASPPVCERRPGYGRSRVCARSTRPATGSTPACRCGTSSTRSPSTICRCRR